MMIDPIATVWILIWTAICPYGLYLLITEDKKASSLYVYGKSLDLKHKKGLFWQLFLLPKRYFRHFYLTALVIFTASFAIVTIYYIPSELSNDLKTLLARLRSKCLQYDIKISVIEVKTLPKITAQLFTLILMIIQSSRRLYESMFISVYSSKSKINIIHYLFGNFFYALIAISTVCPVLVSETSNKFSLTDLIDNLVTRPRAIIFILFIYVSHYQQKCHKILANLRKDKSGRVITEQHYVPSGGLFEFVSCPHFLTEVILYLLIVVLHEFVNHYWNLIFLLVLSTQTISALTEHRWYKKTYKDYSKERKAIFPKLL